MTRLLSADRVRVTSIGRSGDFIAATAGLMQAGSRLALADAARSAASRANELAQLTGIEHAAVEAR